MVNDGWYAVENVAEVASPALLLYPDRIENNVEKMIQMAGGATRLRPHIKTHKLPEIMRLQMSRGISKFKCATIAEAEMAADSGATDVLLAYQPVGPNVRRMFELTQHFPSTDFSAVVDDASMIQALSDQFKNTGSCLTVFLDIDCGMHRTGILPGRPAQELYALLSKLPGLKAGGLHAYDGHLHDTDPVVREKRCLDAFAPVAELRKQLVDSGEAVPTIVAGGTPTFPIHARRSDVECSPGTSLLWDAGYASKLPDLEFSCAAVVLTRAVSKPAGNRLCLDLGHKAIASENPHPRVQLFGLPDAKAITHSEEHLVIEAAEAARFKVGDAIYGIPWHICPTVALYSEAVTISKKHAEARWKIAARARRLTI